jgi:protein-S-isoprenylcysteine O-methyltransferase Ste14
MAATSMQRSLRIENLGIAASRPAHLRGGFMTALRRSRGDTSGIHLSAIVACGGYGFGLLLAMALTPGMLDELAACGPRASILIAVFAVFMIVVGAIQRQMGVALLAGQTTMPRRLCTSGVLRYSRNPIYLSVLLPLASIGVFSPVAAVVSIVVYVLAMTHLVIRDEERNLRITFGAQFEAYERVTPRWLLRGWS